MRLLSGFSIRTLKAKGIGKRWLNVFPHDYQWVVVEPRLQWFQVYQQLTMSHYHGLERRRKDILLAVNAEDIPRLRTFEIKFYDLRKKDKQRIRLIDHIAELRHQPLMDYIFQAYISPVYYALSDHYYMHSVTYRTDGDDQPPLTLLHQAARLNQLAYIAEFAAVHPERYLSVLNDLTRITPLQLAALRGQLPAVSALALSGANIAAPGAYQLTPFQCAISQGHVDVMQFLLEKYPAVISAKADDMQSLSIAAKNGKLEAFGFLFKREGVQIKLKDAIDSLLQDAIMGGHPSIVEMLLQLKWVKFEGSMHLHFAVKNKKRNVKICEYLIDAGAEVNGVDHQGNTPLHEAATLNDVAIMQALIARGANVNAQNEAGYAPLHCVVACSLSEKAQPAIDVLLDCGANIDLQTGVLFKENGDPDEKSQLTPLHLALLLFRGDVIIKKLLERGADSNIPNTVGNTPLHSQPSLAKMLLAHGANAHSLNHAGLTPLGVLLNTTISLHKVDTFNKLIELGGLPPQSLLLKNETISFAYTHLTRNSLINLLLAMPHVKTLMLESVRIEASEPAVTLSVNALSALETIKIIDPRMDNLQAFVSELRLAAPNLIIFEGVPTLNVSQTLFAAPVKNESKRSSEDVEDSQSKRQKTRK